MFKNKFSMEGVVIIILLVMLVGVVLFSYFRGNHVVHLTGDSLVLTFIGILATFIVVGNAQQVREIRNDMHEELDGIKEVAEKNKESIEISFNNQIKKVGQNLRNVNKEQREQKERLAEIQHKIAKDSSDINIKMKQIQDEAVELKCKVDDDADKIEQLVSDTYKFYKNIKELLYGILLLNDDDTSKLLVDLLFDEKTFYTIETTEGNTIQAVISVGATLQFIDPNTNEIIEDICKINGLMYDSICISKIYDLVMSLNQKPQEVSVLNINSASETPSDIS